MADPVNTGFDPEFGGPLAKFRAALAKQGVNTNIFSGVRDTAKQASLYADYLAGRNGVPLAAPPGTSLHERGLAADIRPSNPRDLQKMYALAGQFGIQPLGAKDPYHFQLANYQQAEASQAPNTPWNTLPNQPSQYASNTDAETPSAGGFKIPDPNSVPIPGALSRPSTPTPGTSVNDFYHTSMMHETGGKNVGNAAGGAAAGYYQFMPGTWAGIRKARPDLNLPESVLDANQDQQTAAYHEFTRGNVAALQAAGLPITDKNVFMASFLGSGGATKFLGQMGKDASANAAALFPAEAKLNPTVFYNKGQPRTLQQVYDLQTAMHGSGNTTGYGPDAAPSADAALKRPEQSLFGAFTQGPIDPDTGKPSNPTGKTPMQTVMDAVINNRQGMLDKVKAAGPEETALSNMPAALARNVSPMGGAQLPNVPSTYGQTLNSFSRPLTYNSAPPQAPQMPAAGFQGSFGAQTPGVSLMSPPALSMGPDGQIRPLTLNDYGYQGAGYAS